MYKSKLVQVFVKLTSQEQVLLRSFLKDACFNKHPQVILLYEVLFAARENIVELEKELVFQKLFPKEKHNDLALRHVMSYLLKQIERFGIIYAREKSSLENHHDEILFYSHLEYEKGIDEALLKYANEVKKNEVLTTEEIYAKYMIDSFAYNYAIKNRRTDVSHLIELNKSLDEFFILSKLKVACNIVNQQNIFNQTIDSGFFIDLMEYVSKSYLTNQMISLYYHIYRLVSTNDEAHYASSVASFQDCLSIRKKSDLKDALLLLINFCIKKINQGFVHYEQEVFHHYKVGLDNKILVDRKLLSPFTYSNALNIAIKLNDLLWADATLERYKEILDTEYPLDYYSLNKAKVLVANKKFNEALDFVNKVEINDLLTQLQLRIVQLKIFIELDEYRIAESYIANFKQLIKRKGMINYHKTNFNKIAGYMLKLIHLAPYSKTAKLKLISDISKEPVLSEKAWFMEKLK